MIRVFVNGTFDVIHYGHLLLLNHAKQYGDHLMVALDSDRRIAEKKGPDRPFNNEFERVKLMEHLKPVDKVAVFDSDQDLINIVREYRPHYMFVGSDWKGKSIIGSEYAQQVRYFDRVYDASTTQKIENYIDRRQMCR